MRKRGKKFTAARAQVAVDRTYTIEDAIPLMQKVKFAKFDETVELALRLGVDPKHADQMVRGAIVLPHGIGKTVRVAVFAKGEKEREAREAGADVVLGGEPEAPIDDSRGCIVDRANAKGFAFEYMTSGRAVVLGDLGPWACAGMTGGRVYVRFNAFGIDPAAIERRLGEGAKVELKDLDSEALFDIDDLLTGYATELRATGQDAEAVRMLSMAADATSNFLMVVPHKVQADPSVSTE